MKPAAAASRRPNTVRVVIADDEPLFVEMVAALLDAEEGVELVGKAGHGKDAVRLAHSLSPDVVLMDISMPVMDGIDATREIQRRDGRARVLILTGGSSTAEIDKARQAGAAGFLTKDRIADELVPEIRSLGGR